VGWRASNVETCVNWCGHGAGGRSRQDNGTVRLVPVIGEAANGRPNHDDHH